MSHLRVSDDRRACFYCEQPLSTRLRLDNRVCCNVCHRARTEGTASKPRRVACELTIAVAPRERAYAELSNKSLHALRKTAYATTRGVHVHVLAVRGHAAKCVVTIPAPRGEQS